MAELEIKREIRISREEAGEILIALGKELAGGSTTELDLDGGSIRFDVADQVEWEFELSLDGDKMELEIELSWSTAQASAKAAPTAKAAAKAESPAKPAASAPAEPAASAPAEPAAAAAPAARKRTRSTRQSSK